MTLALASIQDVEAVSKPVPAADSARVVRLIEMVSANVRRYTGQSFTEATTTESIQPHDGILRLSQRPVTAVSAVTSNGTTLDADAYTFTENGYVRRTWDGFSAAAWPATSTLDASGELGWPPVPMTVAYTHGYPAGSSPADISMVIAEKVAVKWISGLRVAEGTASESIDGYSQSFANLAHISAGNAWDPEHKEILDSYRRSGFASLRLG